MTTELKARIYQMLANKVPHQQIANLVGLSKSRISDLNAERLGKRWNRTRDEVGEAEPYRTEPDGLATIEIAKRLGITNRQVQRTLKAAIAKMRDLLEAETITEEP
jgi:DNA-directed RNA polymerase specialized sigma subunit